MMACGVLLIVTGPSGVGKTTLIRRLLLVEPGVTFAVSHTTRPPRQGEVHGQDYYFVDDSTFDRMVGSGDFLEWARVHQHRYGTSRAEVERLAAMGKDVVFDVDYQGGRALMRALPEAASVFVLPPSLAEMRRRLAGRGTEDEEALRVRFDKVRVELAVAAEYRYNVVNDSLERAVEDVRAVMRAERLRAVRAAGHVRSLVAEPVR